MEKLKKQPNFYVREREVKPAYYLNQPIILLVFKKVYFIANKLDLSIPSFCVYLLKEFDDMFPVKIHNGLPPIRGIEHQIDLVLDTLNPNWSAY
jgi:hypothetical protein